MELLTESKIQKVLSDQFFSKNSIKYKAENLFIYDWESDFWLMTKTGYCYEFEIKISRSDYFNDFKRKVKKHTILSQNTTYGDIPNYFYYVTPKDLITADEVPEYAGLLYADEKTLYDVKRAPKLNNDKSNIDGLQLTDKFYYNYRHWREKSMDNQILLEDYRSSERSNKTIRNLSEIIKEKDEYIKSIEKLYGETYGTDKWIIRSLRKILTDNGIQYDFGKIEDDAMEKVLKI